MVVVSRPSSDGPASVLVVDDSAFMRRVISEHRARIETVSGGRDGAARPGRTGKIHRSIPMSSP